MNPPSPAQEFAAQLIRQVLDDLGGVLIDGETPAEDALALLGDAALAGRTRGGALVLLARAALAAHRTLESGWNDDVAEAQSSEVGALLQQLCAVTESQLPALFAAARAIEHYVAAAEPTVPPPAQTLALAIHRLYEGLRNDDEGMGGRGLVEMRALVVHLDATASMLGQGSVSAAPLRVIRPDRFHDYFLRFTTLAQSQGAAGEERAVAALSRDGRIEALIVEDAAHPIVAAAQQVHQAVAGDAATKDHVLARIRALRVFLAALRRRPRAVVGDAVADPNVHLSLIIAAATAPLRLAEEFDFAALAQVARYNQTLLRSAPGAEPRRH